MSTKAVHESTLSYILALADDELLLGHRNSEWTGFAPILEEDIAFSNIAQDELGHSLVWFTEYEKHTGKSPDDMAFERSWQDFIACRFVSYPKGDFAYTLVRQFLFDVAERVRLRAHLQSSFTPLAEISRKLMREEEYHLLHVQGLVERLGSGTEESHRRMQSALTAAFPQSMGMFEDLPTESELIGQQVFPGNAILRSEWLDYVQPVLESVGLELPIQRLNGSIKIMCEADMGGRTGKHTPHLKRLVDDLQMVYRTDIGATW